MTELKDHLLRFQLCGFVVLPLDQAREAYWRPTYFLAHKFIFNKKQEDTIFLQIILGNLKQLTILLPSTFTSTPTVQLGFCGQTILIDQEALLLSDLLEMDESARLAN